MTDEPETKTNHKFVAVIPAGGVGSRLWPLSQPHRPKFLLDLQGAHQTMLQTTWSRLLPISDDVLVVTGAAHAEAVAHQLPELDAANLVAEPSPRDSMAAIALAAAIIQERHGSVVMGSFAADHVIHKVDAFHHAVRAAIELAAEGKVVTIGIQPTGPATAYGYISALAPQSGADPATGRAVQAFTEKPDATRAAEFLATGNYYWNAGMYIMRTDVLLDYLAELHPMIHAGVTALAAVWDAPERDSQLAKIWPTLPRIAIDHAIAEPVAAKGGVAVVPAAFDWHDVGDFDSLMEILPQDEDHNARVGDASVVFHHSTHSGVFGAQKPVVLVGVENVVVVESAEAILVVQREYAQAVKNAADLLDPSV